MRTIKNMPDTLVGGRFDETYKIQTFSSNQIDRIEYLFLSRIGKNTTGQRFGKRDSLS